MKGFRAGACALLLLVSMGAIPKEQPFPPKGSYNYSVHRFFPDLDLRLNAVRYGRWRALEIAWRQGVNPRLDREYSSYLLGLLADPPRFPPEAERVAPGVAREALPIFRAFAWGQVLEQQALDILGAPDARPPLTAQRLQRMLDIYRREAWALSEPAAPDPSAAQILSLAPLSSGILLSGTRLFILAAEDLVASDFGQQRWRVRATVQDFDRSSSARRTFEEATFRGSAPRFAATHPRLAESLDCIARFRLEIFNALVSGGETADARRLRDERAREVARRYGLPLEGIGGR